VGIGSFLGVGGILTAQVDAGKGVGKVIISVAAGCRLFSLTSGIVRVGFILELDVA
jgi:hypothetical protein